MPRRHPRRSVGGMTGSHATAVVFEAVMPALGFALILGASLLPAVMIAALVTVALLAVARRS